MLSNPVSKMISGLAITAVLGFTVLPVADAHAACNATVNGYPMTAEQCRVATQKYGYVEPGHYWMDGYGNWGRVNDSTVRGNVYSGPYRSKGGGGIGEIYPNGDWFHGQDPLLGGGGVGGDANGCVYTTFSDWSNC